MLRGLYASVAPRATRVISRTCTAAVSTSNFSNPAVPRAATRIVLSPHRRTSVAIIEDLVLQRLFRCIPSRCFSSKDQSEEKREYDNEAETGGAGLEGDDETPTWEGLTEEEAQAAISGPDPPKSRPRIKYGIVSSDRMHKTVVVKVPYVYIVPIYGKRVTRHSKLMSHDEENSCRVGDLVGIVHTPKRFSKRKSHKVVVIKRRADHLE